MGNRKSDQNQDTQDSQEYGEENPKNNNKNNNKPHNNNNDKSGIKSYVCGVMGHYATDKECPLYGKKTIKGASFLLADYDDALSNDDDE